jgi:hypothetical protein
VTGKRKLQHLYRKKICEAEAKLAEAERKILEYPKWRKIHEDAKWTAFSERQQIQLLNQCIQEHCREEK